MSVVLEPHRIETNSIDFSNLMRNPLNLRSKTIQTDILSRPELAECKGTPREPIPKKGQLFSHQKFFSRIIDDVEKMILYHLPGTGKSRTVISGMERLFDQAASNSTNIKRAIFIVSSIGIENEIKLEIEKYVRVRRTDINSIRNHINSWYTFFHFEQLTLKMLKMNKGEREKFIHDNFDDTCIFIDEFHELTNEVSNTFIVEDENPSNITVRYLIKDSISSELSSSGAASAAAAATAEDIQTSEMESIFQKGAQIGLASAGIEITDEDELDPGTEEQSSIKETKKVYVAKRRFSQIREIIQYMRRSKIILGSGTPILNRPSEINNILLLINERPFPSNFDYINGSFDVYKDRLNGLVSYVRNLDTGILEVYQGINIISLEKIIINVHKLVLENIIYEQNATDKRYSELFFHFFERYSKEEKTKHLYNKKPIEIRSTEGAADIEVTEGAADIEVRSDGIMYNSVVYPCLMSRYQSKKYNEVLNMNNSFGTRAKTFANIVFPFGMRDLITGGMKTLMVDLTNIAIARLSDEKKNSAVDQDYITDYRTGSLLLSQEPTDSYISSFIDSRYFEPSGSPKKTKLLDRADRGPEFHGRFSYKKKYPNSEEWEWATDDYESGLRKYTVKYSEALRLAITLPGKIQIYMHYTDAGGFKIFKEIVKANGYSIFPSPNESLKDFSSDSFSDKKIRFVFLDDNTKGNKAAFNHEKNDFGDFIKIIVLSPKSGRSLNLRGVLNIIMVSDEWVPARNEQARKRSLRSDSHEHFVRIFQKIQLRKRIVRLENNSLEIVQNLTNEINTFFNRGNLNPLSDAALSIYNYFMSLPIDLERLPINIYSLVAISTLPRTLPTYNYQQMDNIDIRSYIITDKKEFQNSVPLKNVAMCAIDCILNYERNVYPDDPPEKKYICISGNQNIPAAEFTDYYITYFSSDKQKNIKELIFASLALWKKFFLSYNEFFLSVKALLGSEESDKLINFTLENIISSKEPFLNRYGIPHYLYKYFNSLFISPHLLNSVDELEAYYGLLVYSENISFRNIKPLKNVLMSNDRLPKLTYGSTSNVIWDIPFIESLLKDFLLQFRMRSVDFSFRDANIRFIESLPPLIREKYSNNIVFDEFDQNMPIVMHNLASLGEVESLSYKGEIFLQLRILTFDPFRKDYTWLNSDEIIGGETYKQIWINKFKETGNMIKNKAARDHGYYGSYGVDKNQKKIFRLNRIAERIISNIDLDKTILSTGLNITNTFFGTGMTKGHVCKTLNTIEIIYICYDLGIPWEMLLKEHIVDTNILDWQSPNIKNKWIPYIQDRLNQNIEPEHKKLLEILLREISIFVDKDLIKGIWIINYMEKVLRSKKKNDDICDIISKNLAEKGLVL